MKNLNLEIQKRIASLSDKALVEMLESKPGDYVEEALIIGNQEAEQRGGLELIKLRFVLMDQKKEAEIERLKQKKEAEIERLKQLERVEEENKWEIEAEEIRRNTIVEDQVNKQLLKQQVNSDSSNSLQTIAIILLVVSTIMGLVGYNYTQNNRLAGIGSAFGYSDGTYETAKWSMTLGIILFFVGIGLLIGSFVKKSQIIVIQQNNLQKCLHNGEKGLYCSLCGEKID